MLRRELESPYADWLAKWEDPPKGRVPLEITTRVPCAEYFAVRDQALLAHATQIDPESSWFAIPAGGLGGRLAHRGLPPGKVAGGY